MEELLEAMGIKPTEEMSLDEVRTQINDYENFLESLEEITEALETNSGLGLFLQSESEDALHNTNALRMIYDKQALKRISRHYYMYADPVIKDYVNVLLVIWAKTNAKIGEIAFMLENDIEALNDRETEILEEMECHEASEHFEDYMNEPIKQTTPCDYPDNDGQYSCPFDAQGGDDCRNFCGLGVDE